MSHPHSSSTLQNYISSGSHPDSSVQQDQQSSSECFDCQKITKIENHSSSQSSSGDDGQLVQPLHRHIVEHSRQIQTTIFHLQSQIQKLKKANSTKDIVIQQLKTQLKEIHKSRILIKQEQQQDLREAEFLRRQKQVQKIRRQLIQSSQKAINMQRRSSKQNINDSMGEIDQMKQRLKNIEIKFQDRTVSRPQAINKQKIKYTKKIQISSVEDSQQQSLSDEEIQNNKPQRDTYQNKKQKVNGKNQVQKNKITNQKINKNQTENFKSTTTLNDEIQTYIQKIERLESHIQFCEQEMLWMTNYIISFLKMADKFMIMFKQPVIKQHWTMKKKTKIAWRYIKHLLGWFVRAS